MSDLNPHMDAGAERVLEESLERRQRGLDRRELLGNLVLAGAFLTVAVATAALATGERAFSPWLALLFVAAYAVVGAVELWGDFGNVVPTQIVFVPMLLLLPAPYVPLLVAAAIVLTSAGQALRGGAALGRSALAIGDAWFSVGPALVLIASGAVQPSLVSGGSTPSRWRRSCWATVSSPPAARASSTACGCVPCCATCGWSTGSTCCSSPSACSRRSPLPTRPRRRCWCCLSPTCCSPSRASARRACASRSSSGAPTAAPRCCCATCSRRTTSTPGATRRTSWALTVSVAERMGLDEDLRRSAELGALLHDIGKIAVPDEIINKPGPLDDEEWAIMKTHTVEGERMLAQVGGLLADVGLVVRASHERWDGGGYPDGLAGDAIPLAACIVSACDAFNAMTTDRSYRKALPLSVAVGELRKNSGTQFCPAVVDALVELVLEAEALARVTSPAGSSPWLLRALPALLRRSRRPARPDQRQRRLGRGVGEPPAAACSPSAPSCGGLMCL